jgi:hypothetical protein
MYSQCTAVEEGDGHAPNSAPVSPNGIDRSRRVFAGASIWEMVFSFSGMLGMCLVGRVFLWLRSFNVDPDLWWHIKYGEAILATHHWPTIEQYSFTAAGRPWLAYEWLGDVLFAAVYQAGGLRGLGALFIVLGSLFALALYYFTTIRCGNPKAGFLATAVLLNLANWFNLRPQMLGYLFLILLLIILERFRQGEQRGVWLLPLLMLVWVNTHGSWIIGLGTMGVYLVSGVVGIGIGNLATQRWAKKERRHLAMVFFLSILAILLTPYGTALAKYPFMVASSVPIGIANVQEWQSMVFDLPGDKLFLGLVLGFLLVQILLRPKWRLDELGLYLFGTAMAFMHMRFLGICVAFFAPLFAVTVTQWMPRYDRTKEIFALNGTIMAAIIGTMIWFFPSQKDYADIVRKNFPVRVVQYLDVHSVPGPMYNSYSFGGYLLWTRGPQNKVFIDGRSEVYERAGVLSDSVALLNLAPGSMSILEKYNIQSCLLLPGEALAAVLSALPEWEKVYADNQSVLFVRRRTDVAMLSDAAVGRDKVLSNLGE